MGEPLSLLPGAGLTERCLSCLPCEATVRLSGGSLPCEAPGGTTPVAQASSGALESAPAVTPGLSVCRAWRLRGRAADLLSSGQEPPRCPGASRPLPVPGEVGSWAVSRRPVLPGLRCWSRAPGGPAPSVEPLSEPLRAAPGTRSPLRVGGWCFNHCVLHETCCFQGRPGGSVEHLPWAQGMPPGPGSSPASGSPQGACFSFCLGLCLSLWVSPE